MRTEIGARVGALSHSEPRKNTIYFFGYGRYVGDQIPPPEIQWLGVNLDHPIPKIVLDSGKVVWGCECWWGPEAKVKAEVDKFNTVILLDIDQERARRDSIVNEKN